MSMGREVDSWRAREMLESRIKAMELGQRIRVGFNIVREAYPPVGEDGSMLGAFQAIALAANGNRPEPNLTPDDRFRTFLAREGFVISFTNAFDAIHEIERGREKCEACRGLGQRQVADRPEEPGACFPPLADDARAEATISFSIQPCQPCGGRGYLPAKGDPDARFGDHSASDAWIANRKRTSP